MKNSLKLILAGAALIVGLASTPASAKELNVVVDSFGTPVRVQSGDCLRSDAVAGYNACKGFVLPRYLRGGNSVFFNFNSSALTPSAKTTLDTLIMNIKKGSDVLGVRVAGFADRIGNASANERLSKKRADKVRRYLLARGIVNAQVVETRWFGDSVAATNCDKSLPKAELISCLQPDRRVDIEISYVSK